MTYGDPSALPPPDWAPETEADRAAVRDQMERILATPLFKNSRRYPNLLRFVVDQALTGHADQIKERTLGVEVFGRLLEYDTAEDHVVRTAAGEVRRRISQYYAHPGRQNQIRIDLPPGSYVPRFFRPEVIAPEPEQNTASPQESQGASRRFWLALLAAAIAGAAVTLAAIYVRLTPASALDRFWQPVLETSTPIVISIGQGADMTGVRPPPGIPERFMAKEANGTWRDTDDPPVSISGLAWLRSERVNMADVSTGVRISSYLGSKGKLAKLQGEYSTDYSDLRRGPAVLIGAINNSWTKRLIGELRFTFDIDRSSFVMRIRDAQNPSRSNWSLDGKLANSQMTEDYGIITRVLDPNTERMVVVAAGLTKYGTIAAGEFLTDATYVDAFVRQAPPGWERKNLQIVLATKVINGQSGPPRPIASSYR